MAKDKRPPRTHVVDVLIAVGIPNMRAFATNQERRLAADRSESPNGRVHSTREELFRSLLQATGLVKSAGHTDTFR